MRWTNYQTHRNETLQQNSRNHNWNSGGHHGHANDMNKRNNILILEHQDREVVVKDERNGRVLLLLDLKDQERMNLAGLNADKDDDLFEYANHLLGNKFREFIVK